MLADHAPPTRSWAAPLTPLVVQRSYVAAPAFAAGGHRSVLLSSRAGATVRAPCDGVVTFSGSVAGSPPMLTLACGELRATLRWVRAPLARGSVVERGASAGVASASQVGFSARFAAGRYLDPLALLGVSARRRVPPVAVGGRRASRDRGLVPARLVLAPVHLPAAAFVHATGSDSVAATGARPGRRHIAGAATESAGARVEPVDWALTAAGVGAVLSAVIASGVMALLRRRRLRRAGAKQVGLAHLVGVRR